MKTRTIIGLLLIVFTLVSCEKVAKYIRYEDHRISACGITDPLQNIVWLKTFITKNSNSYSITISIYKNNSSESNHIVIDTSTKFVPDESPSPIYTTSVYTCEGEKILFQGTEGPTPKGWDTFFAENTLVAKIWEVKETN